MATRPASASAPHEPPPEPLPIRRLHESLINRIAAGEIIHRPASALKELIENSLDARATTIKITVKDGGLKLLQIQDNASGIRKTDLPILAERFTTSKLTHFADLARLTTYGFRGEALASISHVARLSVVSKCRAEKGGCAWRASYEDGRIVPIKPGHPAEPKACAGNDGTTITAEDLFYNTPTRLAALRSSTEEYARILDVVTKYACHNPKVGFVCKKSGSPHADISTPAGSTTAQAIKMLYGAAIARELLPVRLSSTSTIHSEATLEDEDPKVNSDSNSDSNSNSQGDGSGEEWGEGARHETDLQAFLAKEAPEGPGEWAADVLLTSANYHAKRTVLLLFINHRLVESSRIKRALEAVYTSILPKGACPFIYLSILIDPRTVDANVHPTKKEVRFLDEDALVGRVCDGMTAALVKESRSRRVGGRVQTLLTGGLLDDDDAAARKTRKPKDTQSAKQKQREEDEDAMDVDTQETDGPTDGGGSNRDDGERAADEPEAGTSASARESHTAKKPKTASQHKVRTSVRTRTLDSMFPPPRTQVASQAGGDADDAVHPAAQLGSSASGGGKGKEEEKDKEHVIPESECYLASVNALRQAVLRSKHTRLTDIIRQHVFVGIVDVPRSLSLLQHGTKLYLVNHSAFAEELFYQLGVRQFGNFTRVRLDPPPSIRALVALAVDVEERIAEAGLDKGAITDRITDILLVRREMLAEYFAMHITPSGELESLPLLLRNYTPNLDRLPQFLMRLGPQVDWTDEEACFSTFLRELAYFYVPAPVEPPNSVPDHGEDTSDEEKAAEEKAERWQIEHALFRAMRDYLVAPKTLLDRDVVQVASLPDLYRVFERC